MGLELVSTTCAICSTSDNASVLYKANVDLEAFNPAVFSARRIPDMIHYQIVRCNTCGLVRSDPVADVNVLKQLYQQSSFTYGRDTPNLTRTYGRYLRKTEKYQISKDHILEIGCGNGFFLEVALSQGFGEVTGVEPSQDAIEQANPVVRSKIVCDTFRPGLFAANTFSVICMFQTFDHVSEPNSLLEECARLLRPGGVMLCLNHNVEAFSSRVLKEKSPIIDIEHTYLYSPKTMKWIFEKHSFQVLEAGPAWNTIRLYSLFRLFPMPREFKRKLLDFMDRAHLSEVRITVPLGNLYLIAQKAL